MSSQSTPLPWWKDGLSFGCTGCGRCCQMEGDVWMDVDEFVSTATYLNLTHKMVMDTYIETTMAGWVKLLNKLPDSKFSDDRCIFLDDDGKKCSIYSTRPTQCRTYPYWPRLITSEATWLGEAVLPDAEADLIGGKKWNAVDGGCEGINHKDAQLETPRTIFRNMKLYDSYVKSFPFLPTGDDKNRFLANANITEVI